MALLTGKGGGRGRQRGEMGNRSEEERKERKRGCPGMTVNAKTEDMEGKFVPGNFQKNKN